VANAHACGSLSPILSASPSGGGFLLQGPIFANEVLFYNLMMISGYGDD
jgi:hypothetical protein